MKKSIISLVLLLCVVVFMMPAIVFAAESVDSGTSGAEEETHTHDYYAEVIAPTCTEDGYTLYTCDCGDSYTADTVPALQHVNSAVIVEGDAPTCTNPFGDLYHCPDCRTYFYENTAFTGHTIQDGTCTTCGENLLDWGNQENAWWYLSTDGTLTLCGTGTLDGTPWAAYLDQITALVIDSYVSHVDDWDGESMPDMLYPNLTSIHLANDALGNSSLFYRSPVLQEITVEPGNPNYRSVDGVLYTSGAGLWLDRYPVGRTDTEFTVPDGIDLISICAFYGAKNLEKVHLAQSVFGIQKYAFANCTALKEFRFLNGENYSLNMSPIFTGCTGLRRVWLGDQCENMRDLFDGFTTLEHMYILGSDTFLGNEDDEEHPGIPGKTVIHGWLGSSAQAFAEQFGYQFVELTECDVNGHDLAHVEALAPTCEADGNLEHWHCSICGKNYADEDYFDEIDPLLPASGHSWDSGKVTEPTCTEVGYTTYTCACGDTYTDAEVAALGHAEETVAGYAATCTEAGLTDGKYCTRCGAVTVKQEEIPAMGCSFTEYHSNNDATCIADGTKTASCDHGCGETDTVADEGSLNPDAHAFGEWITEENKKYRTCQLCGCTESHISTDSGDVEIEAPEQPGHDFEVEPVEPTDDQYVLVEEAINSEGEAESEVLKVFDITLKNEDGVHVQPDGTVKVKLPLDWEKDGNYKVYRVNEDGTLTDMNAYRQGSHMVFETDHFSLYVIVEEPEHQHTLTLVPAVEATCDTAGNKAYYTCSGCDSWFEDAEGTVEITDQQTVVIPSLGHDYHNGVCANCGEADPDAKPSKPCWGSWFDKWFGSWWGDDEEEEQCEHTYDSVVTDPTCTQKGYTTHTCEKCGDSYKDSYVNATGHHYVNNVCEHCGAKKAIVWYDWIFKWFR